MDKERYRPMPEIVRNGKTMSGKLTGDHPTRPYYCRDCGKVEEGANVPKGWYSLSRHAGAEGEYRPAAKRLGIFCSAACLAAQMPRIATLEAKHENG